MWTITKAVVLLGILMAGWAGARAQSTGLAQHTQPDDPCGDATLESQTWTPVDGTVVEIVDGDTVIMQLKGDRLQVDLVGIESPALNKPFGLDAELLLARLVKDKKVVVWVNPSDWGWEDRPTPKKIIGVVYLREQNMLDVNLELIHAGFARHKKASGYKMSDHTQCHYVRAEGDARIAKRGLWATSQ